MEIAYESLQEAILITFYVLIMMIAVDFINVKTKGKLEFFLHEGNKLKQYLIASLLGTAPGCFGSFAGVSLYIHGMISFGALTGLMFATAGDEQFIMLAMFPKTALIMFAILFLLGVIVGYITDLIVKKFNIQTCNDCNLNLYHPGEEGYKHYFFSHIWSHIIKKHLFRIFLWTFSALIIVEYSSTYLDLKNITSNYKYIILIISAIIGIIPESGPHYIFITLFAQGMIPFSVLFTSSIVQDGHGLLPLLSYSVKDSIKIKVFNFIFGLLLGTLIFLFE